jgi:dTDP-L-rhamnose 4-epimerase
MNTHRKRALVTGGAGLIGSHIVDLLLREGWTVRILDNLEPQTHKNGKPDWISPAAEFRQGSVQDYETMRAALTDIDVVFHEAAYGGYRPKGGMLIPGRWAESVKVARRSVGLHHGTALQSCCQRVSSC